MVLADLSMSLDGYVAGPRPTLEDPLGEGGERLPEWALAAMSWRETRGREGGWGHDPRARGWWGDDPPFHVPVLDRLQVHVPPVLLGAGARLFEGVEAQLEIDRVIASPAVTRLRHRVAR
jgi:hypothetical protein